MTNVLTLLRRELGQLFRSPLAYVFLVLFVVIVQLPYMLSVFLVRSADLRGFFGFLPWILVAFAALVTMRSWAEERQENTYEMLLTFPMRDWELVVAKFLSTYLFLCVGIACTAALPLMLVVLGEPDKGALAAGYLGALLLAGMWCAAGVFFSSLTRSQLLAAIVTLVLGMVSLVVGVQQVADILDGKIPGLGSLFDSVFGTWGHYDALGRGVLDLADVLFFAVWTALFLYLNVLFVGLRRAPRARTILLACTSLAVGCALLAARLLDGSSLSRIDLTEERLYTLSEGTVNVLRRAEVPVRATFYVSPRSDMPGAYAELERDLADRLEEMRLQSGGMLDVRVVHMEAANLAVTTEDEQKEQEADEKEVAKTDESKSIERRLIERGVRPFQVQTMEATEVSTKYVYATLGLAYREKDEELIAPIVPERLPELESLVASTVARLIREAPPRIALYLGKDQVDPQMAMYLQQMGRPVPDGERYGQVEQLLRSEKYDVVRVGMTAHQPMPEQYDAFVAIDPVEWDDRARYELNRALVSGKPTLLAAQRYTWNYRPDDYGRIIPSVESADPGVDAVLGPLGVKVSDRILMQEENAIALTVNSGNALQNLLQPMRLKLPVHIGITSSGMSPDNPVTAELGDLIYLWGTALELDRDALSKAGIEVQELIHTGPNAWEIEGNRPLRNADLQPAGHELAERPLVAKLTGTFPDAFAGKERPKWPVALERGPDGRPLPPPPDTPEQPVTPKPGVLYVAGCARMWQDGFLSAPGNQMLLLNALASMTLDDDIVRVRSKQARSRTFDKPSEIAALVWTLTPLVFVPFLIIGVGTAIGVTRLGRRNAWNASHGR